MAKSIDQASADDVNFLDEVAGASGWAGPNPDRRGSDQGESFLREHEPFWIVLGIGLTILASLFILASITVFG